MTAVSTETPSKASKPRTEDTLKGVWVSFNATSAPTGSVMMTPSTMVTGNLKLPYSAKRIMKISTIASGPIKQICDLASRNSLYSPPHDQAVSLRHRHRLLDGLLSVVYSALQVTALDTELHSDVARIIFAINKGSAIALRDIGELLNGTCGPGRPHQQVSDLRALDRNCGCMRTTSQTAFALNDLRDGLSADRR